MARFALPLSIVTVMAALSWSCSDDSGGGSGGAADAGDGGRVSDTGGDAGSDGTTGDTGGRLCTPGTGRCIGGLENSTSGETCSEDFEWEPFNCGENELCWGGSCGPIGTCEPEAVERCVDYARYFGCNPIGTGTGEFAVPFNLTCVGDQLIPRVCLEGETMCQDEQVLLACADSGLEFRMATNCFEDDETTLCDEDECITLCQFIEKRETYVGCEYWAVDLDNAFLTNGAGIPLDAYFATFAVAVSNPGETLTADVTIRSADELLAEGMVAPGEMVVFELPPAEIEGTMHGFWGYQITSTVPIVAYQFNPLEDELVYSNDASLLLPTSVLGTEYYVMTRRQTFEQLKGSLTIVATQPGETVVEVVQLPERTDMNPLVTLAGTDIPPMEGGDALEDWTLQQFEVLNIETNRPGADLTGTYISSNRPIAVFGGTEASNAPNTDDCVYRERQQDWVCAYDRQTPCFDSVRNEPSIALCSNFITCCADHLEQQMLPIFAWGREFNGAHSAFRGDEADVWRVMAAEDGTNVTLIGIPQALGEPVRANYSIGAGEWFEFESRYDFEIVADQPIFVGQFLAAEFAPAPHTEPNPDEFPQDAGTGDPAFIMGVPREQYRSDYIFLVPGEYESNWVTIVAPTGTDVQHTDELQTEVLDADAFEPFGTGEWAALRHHLVNEGYHRLVADEPFGAMVHGYDQFVSYGYPAGMDVKKINRRQGESE